VNVALAFVVGSAVTALGILLTTVMGAEWFRWVFLLPWALLGTLVPHPDIGTPWHPFYEGTPLDLLVAVVGLLLSALVNIVIAHFVVSRLRRRSDPRRLQP
jgi:hypothetical protein